MVLLLKFLIIKATFFIFEIKRMRIFTDNVLTKGYLKCHIYDFDLFKYTQDTTEPMANIQLSFFPPMQIGETIS